MTTVEVTGHYVADSTAEAIVTLVTTPLRLRDDIATFVAMAKTIRACTIPWQDAQGRTRIMGSGHPCPSKGGFY